MRSPPTAGAEAHGEGEHSSMSHMGMPRTDRSMPVLAVMHNGHA